MSASVCGFLASPSDEGSRPIGGKAPYEFTDQESGAKAERPGWTLLALAAADRRAADPATDRRRRPGTSRRTAGFANAPIGAKAPAIATVALIHVPAAGHVRALRVLGRALAADGHRVTAWAPPDWASRVACDLVEARSVDLPAGLDPENPPAELPALAAGLLEGGLEIAPALIEGLKADPPDVVIHDSFAIWGRLAAAATETPRVCCTSTFALTRSGVPVRALPTLLGPGTFDLRALRRLRAARREARERFGVDPGGMLATLANVAPTTLVCTSQGLQPGGGRLDGRFHFVGPMLDPIEGALEPALEELPGDRPLVYLSLGTLRNDRADIYRSCAAALADLPVSLLMSIGRRVDPAALVVAAALTAARSRT